MKTVTMYEADDGKQFRREAECQEYEQQCADLAAANDMLNNGATLMAALTRAHQTRPWWDSGLSVEDIEWVDSADYGPGDENEAIRACIGRAEMLQSAIEDAQQARDALAAEIVRAQASFK